MLAAAADRKGIDHGDPRLLDGGALKLVGRGIARSYSPKDFVLVAHDMQEVEKERYFALIEMGEVQASAADPPAGIFRMLDRAAAQHGNLRAPIEDGQVDRDFHGCQ